ncbi:MULTISPECIES: hypothetical protein [unclassified Neisseria]|uniref:hypothetical protein n=1 Tax=unclassified Neisseria TaxID=2623750 RepID=UPI001071B3C7|nr:MULTISPECIES: hypothetical protein [unclassified Neisseria]MBF0803079.1 hypothetical protein [Neisseria sp. 19428wB4_WF04]TFU44370.1 hypothetical protein E4T99_01680 [Neisseria sp. WF04]
MIKTLNTTEIQNVSGGWIANAIGGIVGADGAGYGYLARGGKDPNRFLGAVALGGVSGLFSPVNRIRSAALTAGGAFTTSAVGTRIGSPYF